MFVALLLFSNTFNPAQWDLPERPLFFVLEVEASVEVVVAVVANRPRLLEHVVDAVLLEILFSCCHRPKPFAPNFHKLPKPVLPHVPILDAATTQTDPLRVVGSSSGQRCYSSSCCRCC